MSAKFCLIGISQAAAQTQPIQTSISQYGGSSVQTASLQLPISPTPDPATQGEVEVQSEPVRALAFDNDDSSLRVATSRAIATYELDERFNSRISSLPDVSSEYGQGVSTYQLSDHLAAAEWL